MNRNIFCLVLAALLFVFYVSAEAQQPKKVSRIGYLSSADPAFESTRAEAIRLALRELGYMEGQNIPFTEYAEGKIDRLSELAADLVRLKVDIIVAAGGAIVIRAAKNATKTIPIVMAGSSNDPAETGLVESLAHPGANVTGLTLLARELGGKRLELLKEAVSKVVSCRGSIRTGRSAQCNRGERGSPSRGACAGLDYSALGGARCRRFREGIRCDEQGAPGWTLRATGGPLMRANRKQIVGFALKSRLPSVYADREAVDAGGLMYYGADLADSYRRVAYYVDKILKGAKPADLPVEQPTKFELVINLKTAKQIGVTIPQKVLAQGGQGD